MMENPKVSSFEPRMLRKTVTELERIENELKRCKRKEEPVPEIPTTGRPGILTRWWRWFFGDV